MNKIEFKRKFKPLLFANQEQKENSGTQKKRGINYYSTISLCPSSNKRLSNTRRPVKNVRGFIYNNTYSPKLQSKKDLKTFRQAKRLAYVRI